MDGTAPYAGGRAVQAIPARSKRVTTRHKVGELGRGGCGRRRGRDGRATPGARRAADRARGGRRAGYEGRRRRRPSGWKRGDTGGTTKVECGWREAGWRAPSAHDRFAVACVDGGGDQLGGELFELGGTAWRVDGRCECGREHVGFEDV